VQVLGNPSPCNNLAINLDKNVNQANMEFLALIKSSFEQIEWPRWWRLVIVTTIVGVTAWFSIKLTREAGNVASIWLSDGVLLGVLLRARVRHSVGYLLAGHIGNFAADYMFGDSMALALCFSVCNMLGIAIAAVALRMHLVDTVDFMRRRSLAYFLLWGVILAPMVSALGGAAMSHYFLGISFSLVFRTWYLAVALGTALVTPLVLSLRQGELARLFSKEMIAKTLGILMLTVIATIIVCTQTDYPLRVIMFPVLMLVIFELGFTGTAIAIFFVAIIVITFTIEGSGPMMAYSGLTALQRILFVQITIVTVALVAFPMVMVLDERKRLSAELEKANKILRALAMTDGLTGLANRRRFDEMLEREWRRTARESGVLSMLMVDIDQFKLFNDYYGHQAGDECLKRVSHALAKIARRSGDVCARYGGEEFAVILPNMDIKQAMSIAESIRLAIEEIKIEHVKMKNEKLTVSVGVASLRPRDPGVKIGDLVGAADRALYAAKRIGRNRTMTA
jgi:diguanylate cyclase (GGDEF)-like protein